MIVMVTGHRKLVPLNHQGNEWPDSNPVVSAHHDIIRNQIADWCYTKSTIEPTNFITGMAIGADQLFAEAIIMVKKYIDCTLTAAIPFLGQETKWPAISQKRYRHILSQCDKIVYVCDPGYAPWKMQKRNEWMVDNSNLVLAIWDGRTTGGTHNCVAYAKSKGRLIECINPTTVNSTITMR